MTELPVYLRHAKRSGATLLDLSNRELSFIPKEVFTIKTIEVLNLSSNKLTTIETSITDLFKIKELDISFNSLTELPEELANLPMLKTIILKGNPLNNKFSHLLEISPEAIIEALNECFNEKKKSSTVFNLRNQTPSWLSESLPSESISVPIFTKTGSQFRRQKDSNVEKECELRNGVLELKYTGLEICEQISQGGFSTIHRGFYMGLEVVIKKIFNPNITEESMKEFDNETAMLTKYRHPNIVLLLGAITTPPNLCIVMEYLRDGTLYDLLYKRKVVLQNAEKKKIVQEIVCVLSYLHRHDIVHRDIKSHNILLQSNSIKLCDFGLARHKSELNTGSMQFSGTPTYMAQELFLKKHYSESVDVFAFGTLLYEIYSGEVPYIGLDPNDIKEKVLKDSTLKGNIKKPVLDIINRCRSINIEDRPTMIQLSKFEEW